MRGRGGSIAAVGAVLCALVAGCGSDESSGTLTAKQFDELERLYLAMIPLEDLADNADAQSLRRVTRGTARACRRVDRSDPLLAAMVENCQRMTASLAALQGSGCTTERDCNAQVEASTAAAVELLAALNGMKPVVEREISDQACRDALSMPDRTARLERAVDAIDRLQKAARSGDPDALQAAIAEAEAAQAELQQARTIKQELRAFRAACRPVAG